MKFLRRLIISALAIAGASYLLPGIHLSLSVMNLLSLTIVLALLNALVKPILVFLTFPITILSLGLFLLVINAIMVLVADSFLDGFSVDGFWWALLFSIIVSLISSIFGKGKEDK